MAPYIESRHIPVNEIPDRVDDLPKDWLIAVFCSAHVRSSIVYAFLIPLMVVACGVSMHKAVGASSTLIAAIAFMGFTGHAVQGDFNPQWALPLASMTIIGGILGGKFALSTKPNCLKQIFAYTNWLAAVFMVINAFYTKGGI